MNYKLVIKLAAISGIFAVILGAFGAHGLKPLLSDYQRAIFEKGIQYHFIHTLAILGVGALWQHKSDASSNKWYKYATIAFAIGILFFSGSLYLLATRDLLAFSVAFAGPITPVGGVFFILGWGCLFRAIGEA